MERLKNPKLIVALAVAAVAAIVFLQNRDPITLGVLGIATVQTSVSTALLGAFAAGALTGALATSRWHSQREKTRSPSGAA